MGARCEGWSTLRSDRLYMTTLDGAPVDVGVDAVIKTMRSLGITTATEMAVEQAIVSIFAESKAN